MNENACKEMQERIDTMPIPMREELPVVSDVNLNQTYLPHNETTKRTQSEISRSPYACKILKKMAWK